MEKPQFDNQISQTWLKAYRANPVSRLEIGKTLIDQQLRKQLTSGFENSESCCIFLVDLHAQPNWYRQRIFKDYLDDQGQLLDECVEKYLEPSLSAYFNTVISADEQEINKQDQSHDSWDEAIRDFIDQGKFNKVLKKFRQKEHLRRINRDFCSKVFYHAFKDHFDKCTGMGMVEMIKVGEKHPKTLKKMSLMQEYDDIRAALLKLQLTGKIDSLNYK